MFQGEVTPYPIPERVFELCKIVVDTPANRKEIREKAEPSLINGTGTAYFGHILTAAKELSLIDESSDQVLSYIGERQVLETINGFRRYCNSVIYKDTNTQFYQIIRFILDSNLDLIKLGNLTDQKVQDKMKKNTEIETVKAEQLRGIRFWISFLGFGLIHEINTITFLPNMYTALKDFLFMAKPKVNHEYTVSEFCDLIMPFAHVALHNAKDLHQLNYAMSAALRMMHDSADIQMKRIPDSSEIWNLYKQDDHVLISEISHIVVLKEVQ